MSLISKHTLKYINFDKTLQCKPKHAWSIGFFTNLVQIEDVNAVLILSYY